MKSDGSSLYDGINESHKFVENILHRNTEDQRKHDEYNADNKANQ